jgi:hypothetical protein
MLNHESREAGTSMSEDSTMLLACPFKSSGLPNDAIPKNQNDPTAIHYTNSAPTAYLVLYSGRPIQYIAVNYFINTHCADEMGTKPSRGSFRSVCDLQAAINRFLEKTNFGPNPLMWTAAPNRVLAAVKRGKEKLESFHRLHAKGVMCRRRLAQRE